MTELNNSIMTDRHYESLNRETEMQTNRDIVKYMNILAVIVLACELLNEIGIFEVNPMVMRMGAFCGFMMFLSPLIVLAAHNCVFKDEKNILYNKRFKYFILAFAWLGTITTCIMLTHHAILVMAIPIIIMAQYRNAKELVPITVILSMICILLGVYGGYVFGCLDKNLVHVEGLDSLGFDIDMRWKSLTPPRAFELLTHYALPRELIMLALIILSLQISKRHNLMLKQQAQLQIAVENEMNRTNEIQWCIIDGMANLIENRDTSTGEHVKRTSFYVGSIANELRTKENLSDNQIRTIVKAAPLHDIGKIVVTDRILQKPGRLTSEEYEQIKVHTSEGAKVIKNVLGNVEDDDFLRVAEEISGSHHERWDGKGYPNGLSGTDIPLSARIMAVADVFDALVSKRVYKEPIPPEEAYKIITDESGKQFDPEVVEAFVKLKPEIMKFLSREKST